MFVIGLLGFLAVLIVGGSATIVWGVKRFNLPTRITTIAFAITATSWVAFLITTIGFTIRSLMVTSA